MCGISIIFCRNGEFKKLSEAMQKSLNIIRHRGPDGEGWVNFDCNKKIMIKTQESTFKANLPYFPKESDIKENPLNTSIILGHRRLSIVDLSPAGHQPMCTSDQRYWITYNGEVYNYLEIRQELESLGISFYTNCDTEVVLKAYVMWGKSCLERFNGMFAFAVYDNFLGKLFVARDRFGVKPLYYWKSPEGFFAFASEIKQLTVMPGWKARLNDQRAYDFLNWGLTDHTNETLFTDVYQLQGGHYLEITQENFCLLPKQWYSLSSTADKSLLSDPTAAFHDLFFDAINLRMKSDVAIGSCLSGGIDSSSIVCAVHEILKVKKNTQSHKTFSACAYERAFDERNYIDMVTKKCGVDAFHVYPDGEALFNSLPDIVWQQDEPFGSTSIFAQWSVFNLAKNHHIRVILGGQGADEQLAGYHSFFGYKYLELFKSFQWLTLMREMNLAKKSHKNHSGLSLLLNRLLPEIVRQPILKFLNRPIPCPNWMNFANRLIIPKFPLSQPYDIPTFSAQQISNTNLPMLLRYEDRNSMYHSVEARTPFLDYRLVEFSLSLQSNFKIDGGWTKKILRNAMKNYLPTSVRLRTDKMAFITPEEVWMKSNKEVFKNLLIESIQYSQGLLNANILKLFEQIVSGAIPFNHTIWRVVCFGQWLKQFKIQ